MNIITIPLKQKWGEEIEHKTFFNIDEDLVNYIRLLENDIDNYNKELLSQGEKIYKAIEYIEEHNKLFRDNRNIGEYIVFLKFANELLDILQGSDKE